MDRRQYKTRTAVFDALSRLLELKRYENITVKEIIDEANIGRSTFYAHFETKDELLKTLCNDIFSHVFSDEIISEKTHDFSGGNNDMDEKLAHILHHLKESKINIIGILSSQSGELFMKFFKDYLYDVFTEYLEMMKFSAPADFVLNHFVGSFAQTVQWWIDNKMKYDPEETVRYYMEVSYSNKLMEI